MKRMHAKEDAEYIALSLIAESDSPVGNHRLTQALQNAGIDVAEATAGRILRDLATDGYADTFGRRGRVLSSAGEIRLAELKKLRQIYERTQQLIEAIDVGDVQALLDLLYVRRAVEPEAARLAAYRATPEDINLMHGSACAHCEAVAARGERVDPAVDFHRQLIAASHNDVLIAVGSLLLEDRNGQSLYVLDRISLDPKVTRRPDKELERDAKGFANDHERVLDAIRARDAEAAAEEMREHINRLIGHAERYMKEMGEALP